MVALVADAVPGAGPQPANQLSPPTLELPFLVPGPAGKSSESGAVGTGLVPFVPLLPPSNPPGRASRRPASRRRMFRAIVERHPRVDGQVRFTVRELCTTMRISAASLAYAHVNPGHQSVGWC